MKPGCLPSHRSRSITAPQDIMPDHTTPDPWDSLAESLGAKPGDDAQPRPASQPPQPPRRRERPAARKPAAPAGGGDWDSLAAEFGLADREQATRDQATREQVARRDESTPRDQAARASGGRPAEARVEDRRPPARASDADESHRRGPERRRSFDDREERDSSVTAERADAGGTDDGPTGSAEGRPAASRGEGSEDGGEGRDRRRRRRGRRGGRGRRREDERGDAPPRDRGELPAEGDQNAARRDSDRPRRGVARLPRPSEDVSEGESWREEIAAEFVEAVPADAERPETAERPEAGASDEDGERSRRRRRGRRGGRTRGRSRGGEAGGSADASREPGPRAGDLDDEPLPASYGSRPAQEARPRPAADGSKTESSDEPSRSRGRRRRRSRGEAGEGRRPTTGERRESATGGRSAQGRDRRRRDDSRATRGRRTDFAPVSGRYDEDDEGLEFLGVEDVAREPDARPRPIADDDVLAESGLSGVLDVPSWVEAIGIVIAGNLTARTRSGRGDGGKGR